MGGSGRKRAAADVEKVVNKSHTQGRSLKIGILERVAMASFWPLLSSKPRKVFNNPRWSSRVVLIPCFFLHFPDRAFRGVSEPANESNPCPVSGSRGAAAEQMQCRNKPSTC